MLTLSHFAALSAAAGHTPGGSDFAAMREAGMIEPRYTNAGQLDGWQLTEKGGAWIDAACSMPLPVQAWVIPGRTGA